MKIENLVGIIGWPLNHSVSYAMHNEAFKDLNIDWLYVNFLVAKVPYIRIKEAILGLRALSIKGANITSPYKELVLPYLDRLTDDAKMIGAVNTISIDQNDLLVGHNTDHEGFIQDLYDHNIDLSAQDVLLIGAGGVAKAISYGLLKNGCKQLVIINRTKNKADELAYKLNDHFNNAYISSDDFTNETIRKYCSASLIINATNIGMQNDEMPWDNYTSFTKDQIVYDTIYNPYKTSLLSFANNCQAISINGLGMLIHQAALAFKIWTKKDAPLEIMKKTAHEELGIPYVY